MKIIAIISMLLLALPSCPSYGSDVDNLGETAGRPIFTGRSATDTVAVCLSAPTAESGNKLFLRWKLADGTVVAVPKNFSSASATVSSSWGEAQGGEYTYLRFTDGKRSYVVYKSGSRFQDGSDDAAGVAGLAVEENGQILETITLSHIKSDRFDADLFKDLGVQLDSEPFFIAFQPGGDSGYGPYVAPESVAMLYRHLAGEMAEICASGRKALLLITGHGNVNGYPAVFLTFGEDSPQKFTAIRHFAVDEGSQIYMLDNAVDGGRYVPLETTR